MDLVYRVVITGHSLNNIENILKYLTDLCSIWYTEFLSCSNYKVNIVNIIENMKIRKNIEKIFVGFGIQNSTIH